MRTSSEISELLDQLDQVPAEALEDQDLDFKEWNSRSMADAVHLVVEMAICMANGGGGSVVFGVKDKAAGRLQAILGVAPEVDVNRLKKTVYDSTDPKLMPVFDDLHVPEGSGRILIMHVYPGLPPYTDTSGRGTIRVGKDCQPLTGTLRRRIMVETGETDSTAQVVDAPAETLLSPSALEMLREAARREGASDDMLGRSDTDLLEALGVLRNGHLTRAGLLIAGKESAIREHLPAYVWTHLRMTSDTHYSDRADGRDAIPVALTRIVDRIMADNPITTVEYGMFHFEYRTYPEIALREALMNAFCHADYRLAGPILVKQFPAKLEISNPGGFIGGISPDNILHHVPQARNPHLVDAFTRLRMVNRSNLGVQRMFHALLIEGKEPPIISEEGESVRVTFLAAELSVAFRGFVAEENRKGRMLSVDHLLVLRYLCRHREIDTSAAARICQRREAEAREILSEMETGLGYLDRGGTGRGTYWTLNTPTHSRLCAGRIPNGHRRLDWEAAKTRVLSILRQRANRHEPGLSNAEIRAITSLDRNQVSRMMRQLMAENPRVRLEGTRRTSRYVFGQLAGN